MVVGLTFFKKGQVSKKYRVNELINKCLNVPYKIWEKKPKLYLFIYIQYPYKKHGYL